MRLPRLLLFLAVLVLAGCSQSSPPGPNPGAIRPGEGITEVKLGQSKAEVVQALGQPDEESGNFANPNNTLALYHQRGVEISYDGDTVGTIVLHREGGTWKSYQGSTAEGIWVESTPDDVKRVFGEPSRELKLALPYPSRSTWFQLDEEGRIEYISLDR